MHEACISGLFRKCSYLSDEPRRDAAERNGYDDRPGMAGFQ
jgi:hypothetical protein